MTPLVGLNGKPVMASDGDTGRKIIIHEARVQGRGAWGVEFEGQFELLEILQILGDVIRGIAQRERSLAAEKRAMQVVRDKMTAIDNEEKKE